MKKIHLICNAHIDPVWLWTRDEGMAEAISTFRVAAKFCEEYDGFVFNHNEAVLYEWVEEHEPLLFERIKKLVKEGKWRIMGGWYLQPDCNMPSGEGFFRQIETGNAYFMEKFGVKPTTAVNFDSFGHTRGLAQILKKSGYDSYVFWRPIKFEKENNFIWVGYDGSEIIGHSVKHSDEYGCYATSKGDGIKRLIDEAENDDNRNLLVPWGVGNHGGGPSKIDLEAITKYMLEHPEIPIEHSWCEKYFSEIEKAELKKIDTSLVHCMVGCYTTMSRIKQGYRRLENELAVCEKMLMASGVQYDEKELEKAQKALLFVQFHDVLTGTMVKRAEEEMLDLLCCGNEITKQMKMKAFFVLCSGQKEGKNGEIPILVFNPNPYRLTQSVDVEYQLEDQNPTENEYTIAHVRDKNGAYLPSQNEKEGSSMNIDQRKRICFTAELEPMSINRFDLELEVIKSAKRPIKPVEENETHFIVSSDKMCVHINKKTGLIDKYSVNGKDYLKENGAKIVVYKDSEDPWGMLGDGFYEIKGEFSAVSKEEANDFNGYRDCECGAVRVIDNGNVRTKIQALLKHGKSYAIITYAIPKNETYIDMHIKFLSQDINEMYKLSFNTAFDAPEFVGQQAFGREKLRLEGKEAVYQKWCALVEENKGLAVLNRGNYGGSAEKNIMNVSLLRTAVYSAHPIDERPICDDTVYNEHIDMGEREFSFRITADIENVDKNAEIYNQPYYALSFFPSGEGEKKKTSVELTNDKIIVSAYKKVNGEKIIRLFNSSDKEEKTKLILPDKTYELELLPYEINTILI